MVLKCSVFVFEPNATAIIEMQAREIDSDMISKPSGPCGAGDEDGSLMMLYTRNASCRNKVGY